MADALLWPWIRRSNKSKPCHFFKALSNYDLVVTTYGTVMSEMKSLFGGKEEQGTNSKEKISA